MMKNIRLWNLCNCRPIQNRIFSIGLETKNINTIPFPGGEISNIHIASGEHKDLVEQTMKRFKISLLNPNEKQQIIVDKVLTPLSGINWIKCEIKASDGKEIETYQFDKANKRVGEMSKINIWSDSFFTVSQFEHQQIRRNKLLVILTAVTLVQGLWGLKEFIKFIWNLLINCFVGLCHLITAAIGFFLNIKHP